MTDKRESVTATLKQLNKFLITQYFFCNFYIFFVIRVELFGITAQIAFRGGNDTSKAKY